MFRADVRFLRQIMTPGQRGVDLCFYPTQRSEFMENTAADTLIRTNLEFLRCRQRLSTGWRRKPCAFGERLATALYPAESET